MHNAYKDDGVDMPIAFFTDNSGGDKNFFESNTTPLVVGFNAEWKTHTGNDLVDVIQIAYDSLCIPSGTLSLSDISSLVLGSRIAKDERLSDWACYALYTEQIHYAAIDAYAGLTVYIAVENKPVLGIRVSSKHCEPGTFVALKPPTRKTAIAYGELVKLDDASVPPHKNEVPGLGITFNLVVALQILTATIILILWMRHPLF
ncbi:unnamed protein product [Mucor hiemalis]